MRSPILNTTRNVVLVHGIFDSGRVFFQMANTISKIGYEVHTPSLKPSSGQIGIDLLAGQLRDFIEQVIPVGLQIVLVGFSMGGLVCRYYLQRLHQMDRVKKFISLSAPHHGSKFAYILPNKGGAQMRPNSAFLNDLNADVDSLLRVNVVSIWTPYDLVVIPAESSHLTVGREIKLKIIQHSLMLFSRKSIGIVIDEIQRD